MRGIPNMQVFCPADEEELVAAMPEVIASRSPAYIRYNATPSAVDHTTPFQIGKAEILSRGTDVTIVVYGFLLREAVKAQDILEQSGYSVGLINLRTLKPIDQHSLITAARESKLLATVEDHFLTGGLYSILGEIFLKERISAWVLPLALENRWFKPALLDDLLSHEGFTGAQIADRIITALKANHN